MKKKSLRILITLAMVAAFVAAMTVTACAADSEIFTGITGIFDTVKNLFTNFEQLAKLFTQLTRVLDSLKGIVSQIMNILGTIRL